eukprot:TRINITY_DN9202_c0_g1_i4.p1 TRINITY_DN9202_c0_g1~~TRINITY_DN9202_c0_g1_i4.p1  ORF type:complete len:129 (-),score=21.17 TRINITY_DN9202_c0_g1_i4:152-538(-)
MSGYGTTNNKPLGRSFGTPKTTGDRMDNRSILEEQKSLLQDQDKALDDIDSTLDRIKNIGRDLGAETDQSIQIIDDIQKKSDTLDTRFRIASKHAENVQVSSSTKGLWIVICILILALVVVLIIGYGI